MGMAGHRSPLVCVGGQGEHLQKAESAFARGPKGNLISGCLFPGLLSYLRDTLSYDSAFIYWLPHPLKLLIPTGAFEDFSHTWFLGLKPNPTKLNPNWPTPRVVAMTVHTGLAGGCQVCAPPFSRVCAGECLVGSGRTHRFPASGRRALHVVWVSGAWGCP